MPCAVHGHSGLASKRGTIAQNIFISFMIRLFVKCFAQQMELMGSLGRFGLTLEQSLSSATSLGTTWNHIVSQSNKFLNTNIQLIYINSESGSALVRIFLWLNLHFKRDLYFNLITRRELCGIQDLINLGPEIRIDHNSSMSHLWVINVR